MSRNILETVGSSTLLILASKLGYQTRAFAEAAGELGLRMAYGTDRCHILEDPWGDQALPLHFENPEESARQIVEFARTTPLGGVLALGDRPTPTAARACAALGLPFHSVAAADACRDKYRSRTVLHEAGLRIPPFVRVPIGKEVETRRAAPLPSVPFPLPWVLKPLSLSGSRGVIRANTLEEAQTAFERIGALLRSPDIRVLREASSEFIQIEQYVPGIEIALEALVERGQLKLLAIFDKPSPLTGPYFEETIYVTPSRLPLRAQQEIEQKLSKAVAALGLEHGPIHAEMRLELEGETARNLSIMEVAARCIGGLCARSLRFFDPRMPGELISLESLLVRLALGQSTRHFVREQQASGVMMIPVPAGGIYEDVAGIERALGVEHIESIEITAKLGQRIIPLPEGSSYPGFIFARAAEPQQVEGALREAHQRLELKVVPALPVLLAHALTTEP